MGTYVLDITNAAYKTQDITMMLKQVTLNAEGGASDENSFFEAENQTSLSEEERRMYKMLDSAY